MFSNRVLKCVYPELSVLYRGSLKLPSLPLLETEVSRTFIYTRIMLVISVAHVSCQAPLFFFFFFRLIFESTDLSLANTTARSQQSITKVY